LYHALPAGATPVAKNGDGKRKVKDFEFYYNGWTADDTDPKFG